ncbi:MAG: LuxQ periplasmic sensor domain-containing protein [Campylobacterales bacterium]
MRHREFRLNSLISLVIVSIMLAGSSLFLYQANISTTAKINSLLSHEFDTDMKVTNLILEERYKDMLYSELDDMDEQITLLLKSGKSFEELSDNSPINFSNKIDIAFLKAVDSSQFYDISFSVIDTRPMIEKLINQDIETNNRVVIIYVKNMGDVMLGSKKIVDPITGRVLGWVYAGVVLNRNFSLLQDIKKLTGSEALALFHGDNIISTTSDSEDSSALFAHIESNPLQNKIDRYKNYVYMTKPIIFNNEKTDLKITLIKSSSIFEELKQDNYRNIIVIIVLTLLIIIALEILIKKLFVRPLERLHLFAKGDINQNREPRYKKTLIKEMNDIGTNLQNLILNLQQTNTDLQKRVDEEVETVRKKDRIILEQSRQNALIELLINLAHQWRQPLNVIALKAINIDDILEYEAFNKTQIRTIANSIVNQTKELSNLITEFTIFYEKGDDVVFNIHNEIDTAIRFLHTSTLEIQNKTDSSLNIKGDIKAYVEIVGSIIKNSNEAASKRGIDEALITISSKEDEEYIYIEFKDNCGGLDEDIKDRLFEPYTTTNFKSRNRGLGLFMAQNLAIYRLNGIISAKNCDDGALLILKVKNAKQ